MDEDTVLHKCTGCGCVRDFHMFYELGGWFYDPKEEEDTYCSCGGEFTPVEDDSTKKPPKCHRCGRLMVVSNEGRFASGDWAEDKNLPKEAIGKWFCSFTCYWETLRRRRK